MAAYYNDNDPFVCDWLRNLISAGLIADGDVDDRSIADVQPQDLEGYDRPASRGGVCEGVYGLWARQGGRTLMQPYYDHAGITIYHGDCREVAVEVAADIVFTDPPYNVGFAYASHNDRSGPTARLPGSARTVCRKRSTTVPVLDRGGVNR